MCKMLCNDVYIQCLINASKIIMTKFEQRCSQLPADYYTAPKPSAAAAEVASSRKCGRDGNCCGTRGAAAGVPRLHAAQHAAALPLKHSRRRARGKHYFFPALSCRRRSCRRLPGRRAGTAVSNGAGSVPLLHTVQSTWIAYVCTTGSVFSNTKGCTRRKRSRRNLRSRPRTAPDNGVARQDHAVR